MTRILFLGLLLSQLAQAANDLPLSELKALSQKGPSLEVLLSARRVKPSERDGDWDQIVSSAAKDLFSRLETEADRQTAFEIGKELALSHAPLQADKEFMYRLGELGVLSYSTKGIATPFYEKALSTGDARCQEDSVRAAVSDAFARPGMEREKKSAQAIAFSLCAKHLDAAWAKEFVENEQGFASACPGLLKHKVLSGVKKKKCENFLKESR